MHNSNLNVLMLRFHNMWSHLCPVPFVLYIISNRKMKSTSFH